MFIYGQTNDSDSRGSELAPCSPSVGPRKRGALYYSLTDSMYVAQCEVCWFVLKSIREISTVSTFCVAVIDLLIINISTECLCK